jgi:thiol-disulfide isomerase/thioredoxin
MSRSARLALALLVCGLASPVLAGDRPADAIVKDIEAVKQPRSKEELAPYFTKQAELIGELARSHPDDARLAKLLPQRWVALARTEKAGEAIKEIDASLARAKKEEQKLEGLFLKTMIVANFNSEHLASAVPAAEEFVKIAPKDQRASMVLHAIASNTTDKSLQTTFEDRILKDYPDSREVASIKSERKKREKIGKPFELEFTDAIKGSTVSMKGLRGKVVVVDFWATWCVPCVEEMPKMKTLYAEYKDKGVEFIGVSLDLPKEKGGLDKLKKYVADNKIGWPQYYQGNFWESEFSAGWGINSIPCVFIVDAEGNLYTTEANRKLEKLIPEVLGKKSKTSAGGGQ